AYLTNGYISPAMAARFNRELSEANFGHNIVSIKVWDSQGHILYSNIPGLTGHQYPFNDHLRQAFSGIVVAYISDLKEAEHFYEKRFWDRLIEVYAPVYAPGSRDIIAVVEYYLPANALEDEMRRARQKSWGVVGVSTLLMYIILNTLVARGNAIIQEQSMRLQSQVHSLEALLEQNRLLHARIQRAARRTVELNERFLRRLSSELHDGPLQMLGVAALRLDNVVSSFDEGGPPQQQDDWITADLRATQTHIQEAMREMRSMAAGLRLPEMAQLSLFEVIERAVTMHEQRTETRVLLNVEDLPPDEQISPDIKIAIYRITEEALNNAYKHAAAKDQRVTLRAGHCTNEHTPGLQLVISDGGPGIDWEHAHAVERTHLGLIGMRERAESLGGTFLVESQPGEGTTIRVCLPLNREE
ncbi:MAG: sensor histidine kinase, partial [Anaerolineae bacterium]